MTRTQKDNTTQDSLRSTMVRLSTLAVVLLVVGGMSAAAAQAQNAEVGHTGAYQVEKTRDDYMSGSQPGAEGEFDYSKNSLRAEVWVDKPSDEIYRKGQDLGVGFQINQDAYAVVYRIDTEGLVTILWPRSRFDDGFVFGGHEYQVPVSGSRKLRVSTQEGEGIVEAVVSQYPFDLRALELDFHHENTTDRYDFRVAGDPFLAMNEVNYAVTGLEDAGEYVVTNYTSYYVHQSVDHPRYLCNQCHVDDQVAYDPYRDECTLDIEYDYSWYNGWYDSYGYYPVYGNPVYVYIDPWNSNPWVNYWYRPAYSCAPWYGWGWGWGSCYSWNYSPYYYGDSGTAYAGGYTRYRPLDRTRMSGPSGSMTKTREYTRGSQMVRKSSLSDGERGAMKDRTRQTSGRTDRTTVADRSGGRDVAYRGADPKTRNRTNFDQVATRGTSGGGLRIRESGGATGTSRTRTSTTTARKRHTAAGDGQRAGLVPVNRGTTTQNDWRGTTRVGGRSGGTTVGNSRNTGGATLNDNTGTTSSSRSRTSSGSKTVQPRQRNTRVWNSTGSQSGTSRSRSGTVETRSRSGSSNTSRSRETVSPRKDRSSSGTSKSDPRKSSTGRSSGTVKKSSGSRESSGTKSSGSTSGSRSSGSSSSRGKSSSGSRDSGKTSSRR